MNRVTTAYPLARRVLQSEIEGEKRKRILAVIAAFHDEGVQPSLREIAIRAKVARGTRKQHRHLLALLRRLEEDGHLEIRWATRVEQELKKTNTYKVLIE